jgi:RNA polymerase sigma-70 factor (ECF subfamily)
LQQRLARARWVQQHVFPHERQMRAWFQKRAIADDEIDEAIQEAYYRIAKLDDVAQIANPGGYFFAIARNNLIHRLKRKPVVPLEAIADLDGAELGMPGWSEAAVDLRLSAARVKAMIDKLPERCRRIVELRKIENWSQKEIAEHLGITEKAVEKQVWLGVRAVRQAWNEAEKLAEERLEALDRQGGQI